MLAAMWRLRVHAYLVHGQEVVEDTLQLVILHSVFLENISTPSLQDSSYSTWPMVSLSAQHTNHRLVHRLNAVTSGKLNNLTFIIINSYQFDILSRWPHRATIYI